MEEKFLSSARNCTSLVCAVIIGVLVLGPNRLAAQFFLACKDFFNTGRKEALFPFTLVHILRSVSGPLTAYLGRKYGALAVTEFGSLLCVTGVAGCFFAKNITTISILWGVVYGLGTGLGSMLIPHILRDFFDKHFDKAHGYYIAVCGILPFFLPLLTDELLNQYGLPGTFLILSSVMMNSLAASLTFRFLKQRLLIKHASVSVVDVKTTAVIHKVRKEEVSDSNLQATSSELPGICSKGTSKPLSQGANINPSNIKRNAKIEICSVIKPKNM